MPAEPSGYPVVSIVTPTFNMVRFLEEAIQSVLSQDYPHIEYIVMDGGSSDGTVEILKKYEGRLQWESGPDPGQSDAINRGFLRSRGSIFAYLCADDAYLPGAVGKAVSHMLANPGYAGIYGEGHLVAEDGTVLSRYPTRDFDAERLRAECFICQPAAFLWRDAFAEAGMLDPELHCGMDYDLWIRIGRRHKLLRVNDCLAVSRMHAGSKTFQRRRAVYKAGIQVVKRHYGYVPYPHVYGYCCSLLDKRDGFFEPVPPSLPKYLLSLGYGTWTNFPHVLRFWRESVQEGLSAVRRGAWPR